MNPEPAADRAFAEVIATTISGNYVIGYLSSLKKHEISTL